MDEKKNLKANADFYYLIDAYMYAHLAEVSSEAARYEKEILMAQGIEKIINLLRKSGREILPMLSFSEYLKSSLINQIDPANFDLESLAEQHVAYIKESIPRIVEQAKSYQEKGGSIISEALKIINFPKKEDNDGSSG